MPGYIGAFAGSTVSADACAVVGEELTARTVDESLGGFRTVLHLGENGFMSQPKVCSDICRRGVVVKPELAYQASRLSILGVHLVF